MKITTVVFDKDGTLSDNATFKPLLQHILDKLPQHKEVLSEILGWDLVTEDFVCDAYFLTATVDLINAALDKAGVLVEYTPVFEKAMEEIYEVKTLGDVPKLFTDLRSRGYKIAMLTSDDRRPTELFNTQFKLVDLLESVVCGDDGHGQKPSAEPLLYIAKQLGVEPSSMVMVGDSKGDVNSGQAAGCRTISVLTGAGDPATIQHADAVLPSVHDMLEVLDKWEAE
eukprot:CAMPEP_0172676134 /NCGR_PEP_ID=MMETSP1074-20121228/13749_1 /TAXON_ID=2916 /ORGANISM="Ceratium fusus, Strain PA161109" /LENGTH=225 /DNA_ID=CAMNT_0013493719 /DNA_START=42 /DNA_END=719 /DNA_ORIENTATION=-